MAVLLADLDEVMHLAATEFAGVSRSPTSPNMRLILELAHEQTARDARADEALPQSGFWERIRVV
ncbi:MAG: hypothetical protein JW741_10590 [Sedimentisphaerales bacterium]|nr:hypothetical protein [Sedimentisphaerales bacterium]